MGAFPKDYILAIPIVLGGAAEATYWTTSIKQ